MKKKLTALLLAAAMGLSLTACGGNHKPAEEPTETTAGSNDNTSAVESGEINPTNTPPEFIVMIYSENSADFHINSQKMSASDTIRIEYDNYAIEVNKCDNGEFQCQLYRQNGTERNYIGDCGCLTNEYETIISVPTVVLGIEGYNFNAVSEYNLYDGNANTAYSAVDVAINGDGTPADIVVTTEPTEKTGSPKEYDSSAYAGITFTDSFAGKSITIEDVDTDGCPTAITSGANRTVFERHDDMSKDDHGWIVRVYWSELNGEHGDYACDIVYYSNDNHFEIRGYGFSGDYYAVD